MASVCLVVLSEKTFNWKKNVLCAVFTYVFLLSVEGSCHFTIFRRDCDPFLQVISPGLEKTINPIKTKREGEEEEEKKKGDLSGNLSRSCWVLRGEEKKEQSRGPAYISLSSNSFMSSKLFSETRVTVPLLCFKKLSRSL